MKTITLTQKDIEKAKIQFTDSGYIIDELAYSAGQWTSNELDESNIDYEPREPYSFDYEADLLANTKTFKDFQSILASIGLTEYKTIDWNNQKDLQAGAYIAINYAEIWQEVLATYTESLKDNRTDGISEAYNKELESEITSFQEDQYKEWLNGDHRNYDGVVYEISKYFTEERDSQFDPKTHSYTFSLNDDDIQNIKDKGYRSNQLKKALLAEIYDASNARQNKDKAEQEKRKAERERLAQYKKEQNERAEAKRIAKLSALTQ